jgi:hypothetical protein
MSQEQDQELKISGTATKIGIRKSSPPYQIEAALATAHAPGRGALPRDLLAEEKPDYEKISSRISTGQRKSPTGQRENRTRRQKSPTVAMTREWENQATSGKS